VSIATISLGVLVAVFAILVLYLLGLEIQYRRRLGNRLELTLGNWDLPVYEPHRYLLVGEIELINQTHRLEIMVPELWAEAKLLSKDSLERISWTARVTPQHPDADARPDGYWFAYIVKTGKRTKVEISIDIQGADLSQLQVAWIQVRYLTYGPQGRIPHTRHVIVPLKFPQPEEPLKGWRPATNSDVLPIPTHLLTHLDDPVEVVRRYILPHAQPGDVVAIGETPVAIMQNRFRHPSEIQPGWVARRLCYLFLPTSSLATACGMQTLIDVVGPTRVLLAFLVGAIARLLGQRGVFYQLAGEQARLIDDVTGTLPPYDQFIVLGPANPQQVVDQIQRETGIAAAIVDVNDLRAVKILAASPEIPPQFLEQALIRNPAGNADEQTPIVLIRPVKP